MVYQYREEHDDLEAGGEELWTLRATYNVKVWRMRIHFIGKLMVWLSQSKERLYKPVDGSGYKRCRDEFEYHAAEMQEEADDVIAPIEPSLETHRDDAQP